MKQKQKNGPKEMFVFLLTQIFPKKTLKKKIEVIYFVEHLTIQFVYISQPLYEEVLLASFSFHRGESEPQTQ